MSGEDTNLYWSLKGLSCQSIKYFGILEWLEPPANYELKYMTAKKFYIHVHFFNIFIKIY